MNTESNTQPVIEARQLDLVFQTNDGPVQALRDVNLTVNKGDFVSFIGPSGCGKTTFLRCIAALETPTGGSLSVNGMTPDEARRNRAYGYVFQAARSFRGPPHDLGGIAQSSLCAQCSEFSPQVIIKVDGRHSSSQTSSRHSLSQACGPRTLRFAAPQTAPL